MDTPRVKRASQRMRGALYIDGAWRDARSRDVLPVINPANETIIAEIAAAGADDIDDAATAARRACESGWGRTRATERAALLRAMAASIVEQKAALSRLEVLDNASRCPRRSGTSPMPRVASSTTPSSPKDWTHSRTSPLLCQTRDSNRSCGGSPS